MRGLTPFLVTVPEELVLGREELEPLAARALAAATVAPFKRRGLGSLLGGGSIEFKKSIKLSSCRLLDAGSAVRRSSSSSSEISIAYGSLIRRRVRWTCGSGLDMFPESFCGVLEYAGCTT